MKYVDLTGTRSGKLTALDSRKGRNGCIWRCSCDCGNEIEVEGFLLKAGKRKSCGCLRNFDLVGQKFNKLTAIEKINKDGRNYYRCKCDCGNESTVSTSKLRKKQTKSCGKCIRKGKPQPKLRKQPGESLRNNTYLQYKNRASRKELDFTLSKDTVFRLFSMNCHYCGSPPSNVAKGKRHYGKFTYSGIDRIDSSKGYIEENVVACCKTCNYTKHTMGYEEFKDWIKKVYNHLGLSNT